MKTAKSNTRETRKTTETPKLISAKHNWGVKTSKFFMNLIRTKQ